jgi:hypothetical protein
VFSALLLFLACFRGFSHGDPLSQSNPDDGGHRQALAFS